MWETSLSPFRRPRRFRGTRPGAQPSTSASRRLGSSTSPVATSKGMGTCRPAQRVCNRGRAPRSCGSAITRSVSARRAEM